MVTIKNVFANDWKKNFFKASKNIHVNSFMYEPTVDMSDEHLKRFYRDVISLK